MFLNVSHVPIEIYNSRTVKHAIAQSQYYHSSVVQWLTCLTFVKKISYIRRLVSGIFNKVSRKVLAALEVSTSLSFFNENSALSWDLHLNIYFFYFETTSRNVLRIILSTYSRLKGRNIHLYERHKYTTFICLSKTSDFHEPINTDFTMFLKAKIYDS